MNEFFNTSLDLPVEFHNLNNQAGNILLAESKARGWITDKRENLIHEFYDDLQFDGSTAAISNYKIKIINLDLDKDELAEETLFLNTMKSLEYQGVFDSNSVKSTTGGSCWWAIIVFAAATVSLAACVTDLFCGLAAIGYLSAAQYLAAECRINDDQNQ